MTESAGNSIFRACYSTDLQRMAGGSRRGVCDFGGHPQPLGGLWTKFLPDFISHIWLECLQRENDDAVHSILQFESTVFMTVFGMFGFILGSVPQNRDRKNWVEQYEIDNL